MPLSYVEDMEVERHYKVPKVAVLLDVHQSTVKRLIESGALVAIDVGAGRHSYRIPQSALEHFLERRGVNGPVRKESAKSPQTDRNRPSSPPT